MKRLSLLLPMTGLALSLSACSTVLPYSSDFSCKNDDHGRCIEPLNAYALAVSETQDTVDGTLDVGEPVGKSGKARTRSWGGGSDQTGDRNRRRRGDPPGLQLASTTEVAPYEGYQQALYRELTGLIDQPETPMLTPPKTVRTLILPYSDGRATGTLYMPRYVYSIVEAPQFIMGNYLTKERQNDLASFLAAGRLAPSDGDIFRGTEGPSDAPVELRLPDPSGPELPNQQPYSPDEVLPALSAFEAPPSRDEGAN